MNKKMLVKLLLESYFRFCFVSPFYVSSETFIV